MELNSYINNHVGFLLDMLITRHCVTKTMTSRCIVQVVSQISR